MAEALAQAGRRRRQVLVLLATLVMMAVTARMGWWQLDRAAQKETLQASLRSRGSLSPLLTADLARQAAEAEQQHHRPAWVQGTWVPAAVIYLENRQMGGRPGFFVMAPLRLSGDDAVLVQRGWVPRDFLDRTRVPTLDWPAGTVQVRGRVAPWPSRLTSLGADTPGPVRLNLDVADYTRETGLRLLPLSVVELPGPEVAADGLRRDWPQPAIDVHKHYGYAAQWFAFCAMMAALYVWFQLIRPRRRARRSERPDLPDGA